MGVLCADAECAAPAASPLAPSELPRVSSDERAGSLSLDVGSDLPSRARKYDNDIVI